MATLILNLTETQMQTVNQLAAQVGASTHDYVIARALGLTPPPLVDLETPDEEPVIETKAAPLAPSGSPAEAGERVSE